MKVIEGNIGKSRELEKLLIPLQDKKILLIDSVGVTNLYQFCTDVIQFKNNNEIWKSSDNIKRKELINLIYENSYDIIVFETNDNYENINEYHCVENMLGTKVIVTIQNEGLKNIKIYEE